MVINGLALTTKTMYRSWPFAIPVLDPSISRREQIPTVVQYRCATVELDIYMAHIVD